MPSETINNQAHFGKNAVRLLNVMLQEFRLDSAPTTRPGVHTDKPRHGVEYSVSCRQTGKAYKFFLANGFYGDGTPSWFITLAGQFPESNFAKVLNESEGIAHKYRLTKDFLKDPYSMIHVALRKYCDGPESVLWWQQMANLGHIGLSGYINDAMVYELKALVANRSMKNGLLDQESIAQAIYTALFKILDCSQSVLNLPLGWPVDQVTGYIEQLKKGSTKKFVRDLRRGYGADDFGTDNKKHVVDMAFMSLPFLSVRTLSDSFSGYGIEEVSLQEQAFSRAKRSVAWNARRLKKHEANTEAPDTDWTAVRTRLLGALTKAQTALEAAQKNWPAGKVFLGWEPPEEAAPEVAPTTAPEAAPAAEPEQATAETVAQAPAEAPAVPEAPAADATTAADPQ